MSTSSSTSLLAMKIPISMVNMNNFIKSISLRGLVEIKGLSIIQSHCSGTVVVRSTDGQNHQEIRLMTGECCLLCDKHAKHFVTSDKLGRLDIYRRQ